MASLGRATMSPVRKWVISLSVVDVADRSLGWSNALRGDRDLGRTRRDPGAQTSPHGAVWAFVGIGRRPASTVWAGDEFRTDLQPGGGGWQFLPCGCWDHVVVSAPSGRSPPRPLSGRALAWQFVFPAGRICRDPRWGEPSRYHLHELVIQRAVAAAVRPAGLSKRALKHGYDIRRVQELLGHRECERDDGVLARPQWRCAGCAQPDGLAVGAPVAC
jgi:hypothetical protein